MKDIIKRIQGFWQRLSGWQRYFLMIAIVYAIYTLIVVGIKFRFDHPHVMPKIEYGKIDDWQYDPTGFNAQVGNSAPQPFSGESVSRQWRRYLLVGLLIELFVSLPLLLVIKAVKNLLAGLHQIHKDARRLRQLGWANIMISLPTLIVLGVILLALADAFGDFYIDSDLGAFILNLAGLSWLVISGYLFFSGIFHWGSSEPHVKNLGRRKFWWSLSHFSIVGIWIFYNLIQTIAFGGDVGVILTADSSDMMNIMPATSGFNLTSFSAGSAMTANVVSPKSFTDSFHETTVFESDGTIGLSVGGAKDVNNFRENIKNNYLPEPTDVSYEGLFYDYYFDTGRTQSCDKLFCPSYATAISPDPYTGEDQYFISVGLNSGIKQADFARKKLNLMVVLDISGSMMSSFTNYYYDGQKGDHDTRSKMEIANETITNLMEHLGDDDRLSVVLFDHDAYLAKPFRMVKNTDMDAIAKHILEIKARGGTDMSAGIATAMQEWKNIDLKDTDYENRIIFLTDAMPNSGDTSERGLFGKIRELALDRIYTTFIGVGVDLNSELIGELTKVKGANYYAVHSALDFKRRLADEFEFMVTPLAFDLNLIVEAPGFEIQKVYGSPEADEATGRIMSVNTLFPSSSNSSDENRGGLVLLQMKKRSGATNDQVRIRTTYQQRDGQRDGDEKTFTFTNQPDVYPNTGLQKGIVLTRYASVLKDWMLNERYSQMTLAQDRLQYKTAQIGSDYYREYGIRPITWPITDGHWERGSRPLTVSPAYREVLTTLRNYFSAQQKQIGDDEMLQELDILDYLILQGDSQLDTTPVIESNASDQKQTPADDKQKQIRERRRAQLEESLAQYLREHDYTKAQIIMEALQELDEEE